jgi:large subunit ribosomal protein L14
MKEASSRLHVNNLVLIEDNDNLIGMQIKIPILTSLCRREGEYSKVLVIAQNFV